jgi:tRNA(fMet)-specific endonuclease VapC
VRSLRPYLLDTNTPSYIVRGRSQAARAFLKRALEERPVMISSLTEAELLFGLELRPQAVRLRHSVQEFLDTLDIRPWDSEAAIAYSRLRAQLQLSGKALSSMDLLIAAHALALNAVLVSHDTAFQQVKQFVPLVDWATDLP